MSQPTLTKFQRETLAAIQAEDDQWQFTHFHGTDMIVAHPVAGDFPIHGTPKNPGAAKQRAVQRARNRTRLVNSNVGLILADLRKYLDIPDDGSKDVRVNLNEYIRSWVSRQPEAHKISVKSLQNMVSAELQIIERGRSKAGSIWRISGPDYDPDRSGDEQSEREFVLPALDDTAILALMQEHPILIDQRVTAHYHAKHGGGEGLVEEVEKLRDMIGMTPYRVAQYLAIDPERVNAAYKILDGLEAEQEREAARRLAEVAIETAGLEPDDYPKLVQAVVSPEPPVEPEIDVPVIDRRTGDPLPMPQECGHKWSSRKGGGGKGLEVEYTCGLEAGHDGPHASRELEPPPAPKQPKRERPVSDQPKPPKDFQPYAGAEAGLVLPPEVTAMLRAQLVGDLDAQLAAAEDRATEAEQKLAYAVEQLRAYQEQLAGALPNLQGIYDGISETVALVTTV